jgi:uncharacterized repeat protein (TIGR03803 family)
MHSGHSIAHKLLVDSGLACLMFGASCISPAMSAEKVVYSFQGGADGAYPFGSLIADTAGNLYGSTAIGGGTGCKQGCGTIFKLASEGTETILYAFKGGTDGAEPSGALVADSAGNFYGTTMMGGPSNAGTVFKLAPDGTETVLYAFTGGSDGWEPDGTLVMDKNGDLYGTTVMGGGVTACEQYLGCGTVFEVKPDGTETVLYAFQGGTDAIAPSGGVIRDASGNLYGAAAAGGTGNENNCGGGNVGCGAVFKISPGGAETVLYSFQGGSDGFEPLGGLLKDKAGNLYGTTGGGGNSDQGTVFKLASDGTESVLYAFKGGSDGNNPETGVIMDKAGNLYGATASGGGMHCSHEYGGCGTVFKLAPDGTETVLFAFYGSRGRLPVAGLLMGKNGLLYGTTTSGGTDNDGVVFSVKE